jgi:hypothetical protein
MPQCTIKKVIRKIPVSAIVNFLPIEEVKSCLKVIMQKLIVEFWKANLRHNRSKNYFEQCFYANDTDF